MLMAFPWQPRRLQRLGRDQGVGVGRRDRSSLISVQLRRISETQQAELMGAAIANKVISEPFRRDMKLIG